MAITFEEGLSGIAPTAECLSYPYVENGSAIVGLASELQEDNFGSGSGSISSAITSLEGMDQKLASTGYYYEIEDNKKELMAEVISEMNNLKTMKTGIDPAAIQSAISTYNDNLELAQKQYYFMQQLEAVNAYNSSGSSRYILSKVYQKSGTIPCGEITSSGYKSYNVSVPKDDTCIRINYDSISCAAMSSNPQDVGSLNSANSELASQLARRGKSVNISLPSKPSN